MFNELLGDIALSEAELQARVQDIVAREWPQWRRERALRLGSAELVALNGFFDALALEIDAARVHHADLFAAQAVPAVGVPAEDPTPTEEPLP